MDVETLNGWENDALLKAFVDGSPDAICIRDREFRLLLWNESFARGVKENCGVELRRGMRAEDYVPPEQLAKFEYLKEPLARVLDGDPQEMEFAYPCADGSTRYFMIRWSPVRIRDEVVAIAEVSRDITARVQAEEETRRLNELFRGYLESSTENIYCFEIDPPMPMDLTIEEQLDYLYDHTRVAVANAAWARQAGFDGWESIVGLPLDEVVPRAAPGNETTVRMLADANYSFDGFVSQEPDAQGELRTTLSNQVAEIRDGHLVRTWGTSRDITEQEKAREERRATEHKYRALVESANEAIIVSQDGQAKFWNEQARELLGYTDEDMASAAFQDLVHPDDLSEVREQYRRRLSGEEKAARYTTRLLDKEGAIITVIVNSAQVEWEGSPASLVMLTDISERVAAQQEAHRQRDALARVSRTASMEQVAGSIAHELNQPLTGILSNAQAGELMIERDLCHCDEMKAVIGEIVADAKRAGNVIRNLRDLYRKQEGERQPVDLNAMVQDTIGMLHSEFVLQDIQLDTRLPETEVVVKGNRVQLQQVLLNLLANAIEAMQELDTVERHVSIGVEVLDQIAALAVEDRGKGIGADRLEGIFEPLATWKPGGTGMGLAISASIIKAHGGTMWAENRPEGGARVGFRIPLNGDGDDD